MTTEWTMEIDWDGNSNFAGVYNDVAGFTVNFLPEY
jgi:hypothetical protein